MLYNRVVAIANICIAPSWLKELRCRAIAVIFVPIKEFFMVDGFKCASYLDINHRTSSYSFISSSSGSSSFSLSAFIAPLFFISKMSTFLRLLVSVYATDIPQSMALVINLRIKFLEIPTIFFLSRQ